jgi:hypothetical protein
LECLYAIAGSSTSSPAWMPVGHGQRQELRARTRAAAGIRATYTRVEEVRHLPAACKLVDENRPGTSKPRKTRTGSWSLPLPALPLSAQGPYRDISDDLNSDLTIAKYSRVASNAEMARVPLDAKSEAGLI